jgi:2,4-dienoyl-CoA reductase-like NADH-dependent reductase (Old Yellow Enzyme family)
MFESAARYPHAFRPIALGPALVRNRIFVPAHTTNYGEDNLPSRRHLDYHRARAAGGVGLIIFEAIRVHRSSLGRSQGVNGYERAAIPAFSLIARAVQDEGAKLFGQVIHLGRHIDGNFARMPAWSSSAVPWSATAPPPHPMTEGEIEEVIAAHADVAGNLIEAGLDGVEVTLGHGHLLQQFLSPAVNHRTDRWGGDEAGRMRMPLETLRAVRATIGTRAAMGIRISADEFLEAGLTLADMQRITAALAADVQLDFINVSHSAYHGSATMSTQMADMAFAQNSFHHLPRGIAAAVPHVPVFAVCRFRTIAEAEEMLAPGDIAMVGLARAHMADPAIVRKAAEGREAETRPCIGCNQGCAGFLALSLPITCLANPAMGREGEWPDTHAATAKRILVVGGGPAGMEAAGIAAKRGHHVTLWEASPHLGGALRQPVALGIRADFQALLDAQIAALSGVHVQTNRRATADAILAGNFDAVVLATGATPTSMPGALTMEAALANPEALGDHVTFEDRLGSFAIAGFIEWLAATGRKVTILAPTGTPAWLVNIYSSFAWRARLRDKSVRILPLHTAESLTDGTLHLRELSTGEPVTIEGVTALVAPTHATPDDALAAALQGHIEIHLAGDAAAARSALEAIFEGHETGRSL